MAEVEPAATPSHTSKRDASINADIVPPKKGKQQHQLLSPVLLTEDESKESDKFSFDDFAENINEYGSLRELYRRKLNGILDDCVNFKSLLLVDFNSPPKPQEPQTECAPRNEKSELIDLKGKQANEFSENAIFVRHIQNVLKTFEKILEERKLSRLNYYEFVSDPYDYGATIHNCFCVSFLLQDMKLYLEKKEDDEFPFLRGLTKEEKIAADKVINGNAILPTEQTINTFTYTKWLGIVLDLNLTEALIKPEK